MIKLIATDIDGTLVKDPWRSIRNIWRLWENWLKRE